MQANFKLKIKIKHFFLNLDCSQGSLPQFNSETKECTCEPIG